MKFFNDECPLIQWLRYSVKKSWQRSNEFFLKFKVHLGATIRVAIDEPFHRKRVWWVLELEETLEHCCRYNSEFDTISGIENHKLDHSSKWCNSIARTV